MNHSKHVCAQILSWHDKTTAPNQLGWHHATNVIWNIPVMSFESPCQVLASEGLGAQCTPLYGFVVASLDGADVAHDMPSRVTLCSSHSGEEV